MKLYYYPMSQPSRAVEWFVRNHNLKEQGIELCVIDLAKGANLSPEYSAKTPFQSVPILELGDGSVITESGAILVYLAEKFDISDEYPSKDLLRRTRITEALLHHESLGRQVTMQAVRPLLVKMLKPETPWEGIQAKLKEGAPDLRYALALLDKILTKNKWIAGADFSIADYLLISEVNQLEATDHIWEGVDEKCFASNFPAIQRYLNDAAKLPGYAENAAPVAQMGGMLKVISSPLAAPH